ncbi:hypothetical protein B0I73DRAFT_150001 [Yarrowia lipolytica]|nr:hypothetical protein B0I73DRAFT_150001 [Yarrowia lipolytica]
MPLERMRLFAFEHLDTPSLMGPDRTMKFRYYQQSTAILINNPQHEFSSLTPLVTLPKFNCLFKSCHDMPADVIANYFGHQFVKPTANIQRRKGQVPPLGVNPVQQNLQANEGYSRGMFWAAIEVPVVYDDEDERSVDLQPQSQLLRDPIDVAEILSKQNTQQEALTRHPDRKVLIEGNSLVFPCEQDAQSAWLHLIIEKSSEERACKRQHGRAVQMSQSYQLAIHFASCQFAYWFDN